MSQPALAAWLDAIGTGLVRAVRLYLRSRCAWQAPIGIVVMTMAAALLMSRVGMTPFLQDLALVLWPGSIACLIVPAMDSPFGEPERTAALALTRVRLAHLLALLAWAAALIAFANGISPWVGPNVAWMPLRWLAPATGDVLAIAWRNLLLFAGLGCVGAGIAGSVAGWTVPLVTALLLMTIRFVQPDAWWVPAIQTADHVPSMAVSVSLFVAGLWLVTRSGSREPD